MKKIKIRPEGKKIAGKEFNPVEFFSLYKTRILRICVFIILVILCLMAIWVWQENKNASVPVILSQARDLFSNGKYEASLNMYKQFFKQFPRHKLAPASLLGIAYCYEELGNTNEAKKVFVEIQKKFPDSPWIEDAVKGIERLG